MLQKAVPTVAMAFLMFTGTGCEKNSCEAVVLSKEYIAAAVANPEPPGSESAPSPGAQLRPMANDEIGVDGYVMRSKDRGTSRDPRALKREQWIVKVRVSDNGRIFQVPADQTRWESLHENDRIRIRYRTGRYTRTIWAAEIE